MGEMKGSPGKTTFPSKWSGTDSRAWKSQEGIWNWSDCRKMHTPASLQCSALLLACCTSFAQVCVCCSCMNASVKEEFIQTKAHGEKPAGMWTLLILNISVPQLPSFPEFLASVPTSLLSIPLSFLSFLQIIFLCCWRWNPGP